VVAGPEGFAHGVINKATRKGEAVVKAILGMLITLLASLPVFAQMSSGYMYVFGGPVVVPKSAYTRWNGDFVHVGGGGEGRLTDRFALGGEIGVLKPVTNQYAVTTALASVTPAFHFIRRDSKRKFDPFVDGGLSLLAGKGGAFTIHYGGGMNYWLRRRIGLRFEFRHHIWSVESGEAVHMVGFRVGMVFGTG
jgi:hypothetical protein